MSTNPDCLFCKIIAGTIPCREVYSDEHAIAFLDIGPWHRGHSLVVPRRHVADLLETPQALTEIVPAIEATSTLLVERLGADGLNLLSSARSVAGQEIFHLHVHLIPRYASAPGTHAMIAPHETSSEELDAVHAKILEPR